MKSYNEQYAAYVDALEERLELECGRRFLPDSAVGEAARYSLMRGQAGARRSHTGVL